MAFFFGVSKKGFLESRVVPANDNDVFNDNKCAFCWGGYDDKHPAMRILPCNHVFGRDCLREMIEAPNGDLCILCRTPLFRPSLLEAFKRKATSTFDAFIGVLSIWYYKWLAFFTRLPRWVKLPLSFLWYLLDRKNVGDWFSKLLEHCTGLTARNPHLNLRLALQTISGLRILPKVFLQLVSWIIDLRSYIPFEVSNPKADKYLFSEGATWLGADNAAISAFQLVFTVTLTLWMWKLLVRGHVTNRRDLAIVAGIFIATVVLLHMTDIWVITCFIKDWDPREYWIGTVLLWWGSNYRLEWPRRREPTGVDGAMKATG